MSERDKLNLSDAQTVDTNGIFDALGGPTLFKKLKSLLDTKLLVLCVPTT